MNLTRYSYINALFTAILGLFFGLLIFELPQRSDIKGNYLYVAGILGTLTMGLKFVLSMLWKACLAITGFPGKAMRPELGEGRVRQAIWWLQSVD